MHVNPVCFCGLPEDLVHIFTTCHFAWKLLDWFLVLLRRFRPSRTSISISEILFGFSVDSHLPIVFTALLGVLRHFEHIPPDAHVALQKTKSTFRFLVRMHKRHSQHDRFVREWLADGFIGSLTEEDWILFTRDFIT